MREEDWDQGYGPWNEAMQRCPRCGAVFSSLTDHECPKDLKGDEEMTECWWFDHNLCSHADPKFCNKLDGEGRIMVCPRLIPDNSKVEEKKK